MCVSTEASSTGWILAYSQSVRAVITWNDIRGGGGRIERGRESE